MEYVVTGSSKWLHVFCVQDTVDEWPSTLTANQLVPPPAITLEKGFSHMAPYPGPKKKLIKHRSVCVCVHACACVCVWVHLQLSQV